jgi:hypothetical protein
VNLQTPGNGMPTGTVTFLVDGNAVGSVNLVNGAASFTVTNLSAGAHSFAAIYGGGAAALGSTSTSVARTVQAPSTTPPTTPPPVVTPPLPAARLRARVVSRTFSRITVVVRVRLTLLNRLGGAARGTNGTATIRLLRGPRNIRVAVRRVRVRAGTSLAALSLPAAGTFTFRVTFGRLSTTFTVTTGGRRQG